MKNFYQKCLATLLLFSLFGLFSKQAFAQVCQVSLTFDQNNICAPAKIRFTATATGQGELKYFWDFGEGLVEGDSDTLATIDLVGTGTTPVTVKVVVEDTSGCRNDDTAIVQIKRRPNVDFDEANGFRSCLTSVDGTATAKAEIFNFTANPANYTYTVDWGEGAGAIPVNQPFNDMNSLTHTYNNLGVYNINITTTDPASGCTTSSPFQYSFDVFTTPVLRGPLAQELDNCEPSLVKFENQSQNVSPNTVFTLDFGDGTSTTFVGITGNTIFHTYASTCQSNGVNSGVTATLTAENNCGAPFNSYSPITIYSAPQASFTPSPGLLGCVNIPFRFINNSKPNVCASNSRTDYIWDWDDDSDLEPYNNIPANRSPQQEVFHTFDTPGNYEVHLRATNESTNGCGSTDTSMTITICEPVQSAFTALYQSTNAIADASCSSIINIPCPNVELSLVDNSPAGVCPNRYRWTVEVVNGNNDFIFSSNNSNMPSTAQNETIRFNSGGTYIIRQSVGNGSPCESSETCVTVVIGEAPSTPNISSLVSPYCLNDSLQVEVINPDAANNYTWLIEGQGATNDPDITGIDRNNSTLNFIIDFPPGDYQIKLVTSNACGEDTTTAQPFQVIDLQAPVIIPDADTTICEGQTITLSSSDSPNLTFRWFRNNQFITGSMDPNYEVSEAGSYTLEIIQGNCSIRSAPVNVSISTIEPPIIQAQGDTLFCENDTIQVILSTNLGNTLNYQWQKNGENIPGANQAQLEVDSIGSYQLLIFEGECRNGSNIIQISQKTLPLVSVGSQDTIVLCDVNEIVQLEDATPVGGIWSSNSPGLVDSNQGLFNPSVAGGIGIYELVYTFKEPNAPFCTNSDTLWARIIPRTLAQILNVLDSICENSPPLTLEANIEGGIWSIDQVVLPTNQLAPDALTSGIHELVYQVGSGSCFTTDTLEFTILTAPTINLADTVQVCANVPSLQLSLLTPLDNGIGSWSSADNIVNSNGLISPKTVGVGSYELTFSFTDANTGCTSARSQVLVISPLPETYFESDSIYCVGEEIIFQDLTTITSGNSKLLKEWNYNDGSQPDSLGRHTYFQVGTYIVSLKTSTDPQGCDSVFTKNISIVAPPRAEFTKSNTDLEICGPVYLSFTDHSEGINLSYEWDFGNGQPNQFTSTPDSVLFIPALTQDTTYRIKLTITQEGLSTDCNSNTYIDSVVIKPTPTARFIFTGDYFPSCSGFPVPIDNFSTGNPDYFVWDFGDGSPIDTTFSEGEWTHTFFYEGEADTTYIVKLTAVNACGVDTKIDSIKINPLQVRANFNINADTLGCAPHIVHIVSNQVSGINKITWEMGNGDIIPDSTIFEYQYDTPGIYFLKMTVQNGCNIDSDSIKVTVKESPIVDFDISSDSLCVGEAFIFTNNSDLNTNSFWEFGDGTEAFKRVPNPKIYDEAGTYLVSLTITDPETECSRRLTQEIKVIALPQSDFELPPLGVCQGEPVQFTNTSTRGFSYNWNFGQNEGGSLAENPVHTFQNSGTFIVQLIVTNIQGCKDTLEKTLKVFPKPKSDFRLAHEFACNYPFTLEATNLSQSGSSYIWLVNNTQVSTNQNLSFKIDTNGDYEIRLITISPNGCRDTSMQRFEGLLTPNIDFEVESQDVCQNQIVSFTALSQNTTAYLWDFGDGNTSTSQNPTHIYRRPGTYTITLNATNQGKCNNAITREALITVYPIPTAAFDFLIKDNPRVDGTVFFANQSANAIRYHWDFGDGESSDEGNPVHRYQGNGSFQVILTATDQRGCEDKDTMIVEFDSIKGLFVPTAFTPGHQDPKLGFFLPVGVGLNSYSLKIFDTWGNLIWESNSLDQNGRPDIGWDGSGKQAGVYTWKIEATFINGDTWQGQNFRGGPHRRAGTVTLIR